MGQTQSEQHKKIKMKPIRNQIVFKPFITEEKTNSGFFVPENARKPMDKGVIVAVGNGSKDRPMRLKKGQIAYRVHQWGTAFEMNGEKLYLMEDNAILATEN